MIVRYRVRSRCFSDRPDWQVLDDHVPIGKIYRIDDATIQTAWMFNIDLNEGRHVLAGIDMECGRAIPLDTMELVEATAVKESA